MTEPKRDYASAVTFSLYTSQVAKVLKMVSLLGMSKSDVVRSAIDRMYASEVKEKEASS